MHIFYASVTLASFIEVVQFVFIEGRYGDPLDIVAAALGSCGVFAIRKEESEKIKKWLGCGEEDDDYGGEENGQRVGSLVV